MNNLRLVLIDPDTSICSAFREQFKELPNVEIVNGCFEELPEFDCMVSAANSFGLMDGGVDLAIIEFFGQDLQERVQQHILVEYLGEQPVGTSFIVVTDNPDHPFVAHTPTMRVPMDITNTDNVYLAMSAMLLAVHRRNQSTEKKIQVVACPGLGASTGRMLPREAARQMALAYKNFLNPPGQIDWRFAEQRQSGIIYGGDMWPSV